MFGTLGATSRNGCAIVGRAPGREWGVVVAVGKAPVPRPETMAYRGKCLGPYVPIAAAGLLSAILWSGCTASGQKRAAAEPPPTPVTITELSLGDVKLFSEFAAQTYARDMVEVRGRVEGYLDQWLFPAGRGCEDRPGPLRAGPAALRSRRPAGVGAISTRREADLEFAQKQVSLLQAQANLAAAEANLLKAQQDVDRLQPLVEADAASKQDLDAAAAALKANTANVERTEGQCGSDGALDAHPDRQHEGQSRSAARAPCAPPS